MKYAVDEELAFSTPYDFFLDTVGPFVMPDADLTYAAVQ